MTYADMITLLLCFFAIFLTISIARKDVPQTGPALGDRRAAGAAAGFPRGQSAVPRPRARAARPDGRCRASAAQASRTAAAQDPAARRPQPRSAGSGRAPPAAHPKPPDRRAAAQAGRDRAQGRPDHHPRNQQRRVLRQRLRDVEQRGRGHPSRRRARLKSDEFRDYAITVEGHTDDTPIHTAQFPSNWELSTARAAAVVHFLLDQGIPARKLRAAGYADTFPKLPNRDADGNPIPENQAQNRRVVIKLEKIEPAERAPAAKLGAATPAVPPAAEY